MSEKQGIFITFEGIEGCGKSTQMQLLAAFLEAHHIRYVASREPGGTRIGAGIRSIVLNPGNHKMDPACEALLYLADRAQHVAEVVKPNLAKGHWVICDRYHDSTLAYQGAARGIPAEQLAPVFQLATGGLQPDVTFLLDLDPQTGLARALSRNHEEGIHHTEGRFEREKQAFHQKVRDQFLAMATTQPQRFIILDASQTVDQIQADIRRHLSHRWSTRLV